MKNSLEKEQVIERIIEEAIDDSVKRNMTEFAKASFIDRYPDARDGLKPIARRIIYSMHQQGLTTTGGTKKCAKIVGDVIGTYHPHGDTSAYGALVAMAQPFGHNYPIVFGQGNFGNLLGDGAAAYRYTECKFAEFAKMLIRDLSDEVVEYVPNFDNTTIEPTVLPAIVPNLLINGCYTIGGAAFNSSIPSHNLNDVCDLVIKLIENPDITNEKLCANLMPDFPFGAALINPEEVKQYYTKGTPASLKMIGKWTIDPTKNQIHITELPYLVDGNNLKTQITTRFPKLKDVGIEMINETCTTNPTDTLDFIITYTRGTDPYKLIELLKQKTSLMSTAQLIFSCVINDELMVDCTIKDILVEWLTFRRMVVRKGIIRDIQKIYREVHILDALIGSYEHLDDIIQMIRNSQSRDDAIQKLISKYRFTVLQANAISGMKLYELTKNSKQDLVDRRAYLSNQMNVYRSQLNDKSIDQIIIGEQLEAKKKFGRPRRTEIIRSYGTDFGEIEGIDTVLSLNSGDSISVIRKKFLVQGFGGKSLAVNKSEVRRRKLYHYNTQDDELFAITNFGYIYKVELIKNTMESATVEVSKWTNLHLKISPRIGEEIVELLPIPKARIEDGAGDIIMTFQNNNIKRMSVTNLPTRLQKVGTRFIPMVEGDLGSVLSNAIFTSNKDTDSVVYTTSAGRYHLYELKQLTRSGKTSLGCSGTTDSNPIVDVNIIQPNQMMFIVSGDGGYSVSNFDKLISKRRTSAPAKLDNRITGKDRAHSAYGVGPITAGGTLVTGMDGSFKVVDFNSASFQELTPVVDGSLSL